MNMVGDFPRLCALLIPGWLTTLDAYLSVAVARLFSRCRLALWLSQRMKDRRDLILVCLRGTSCTLSIHGALAWRS